MKRLLVLLLSIWMLSISPIIAFADDHYYNDHHDSEEFIEELGEWMGWGSIAFAAVAIALFPVKKIVPFINKEFRKRYASFLRFILKLHIPAGVTVFILAIAHGIILYLTEGEFGSVEWIGTFAVIFFIVAGIVGSFLAKKKQKQSLRSVHVTLLTIALIATGVHIFLS